MNRWFPLFLAGLMLLLLPGIPAHAEGSTAQLLLEANTGCVLSEENAQMPLDPGAFSKLMTAYLAAKAIESGALSEDTELTAGEGVRGMQGAVIWLEPGDRITVRDLLSALLVGNANDAAEVLAQAVSGSTERFVMDMNAAAFDLMMRSTHFTSPQGFPDANACTTAGDLGRLACAVLHCKVLLPYLATWRTFVRDGQTELVNENTLTRTYEGCLGLKASHDSGYSLIAAAERDGMICVAVVLGCEDEDERFALAKGLLKTGFSGYHITAPGYTEEFLLPLRIRGGTEQAVLLRLSKLPVLAIPGGAQIESVTVLPEFRQAPVRAGEQVGRVYFYEGDTLLADAALCAAQDVPVLTFRSAWQAMCHAAFS